MAETFADGDPQGCREREFLPFFMVTNEQQACRQAVGLESDLNIYKGKMTVRSTLVSFNYTFLYKKESCTF